MSTESEASSFVEINKGCLTEVVIRRSTFVFNSEVWIEDEKTSVCLYFHRNHVNMLQLFSSYLIYYYYYHLLILFYFILFSRGGRTDFNHVTMCACDRMSNGSQNLNPKWNRLQLSIFLNWQLVRILMDSFIFPYMAGMKRKETQNDVFKHTLKKG